MSGLSRFALVANPDSTRAIGFVEACRAAGLGETNVISWEEWLPVCHKPSWILRNCDFLRVETPAENPIVERLILSRGAAACEKEGVYPLLSQEECLWLPPDDGTIRFQRQWYLGWTEILETIARSIGGLPIRVMNDPREIGVLFDKEATRLVLEQNAVPVPGGAGLCADFDELVAKMDATGWDRVFLKPCHGSSASGVMAITRNTRGDWQAATSAVLGTAPEYPRIRNSKRVIRLTDPEAIRATVNAVCRERAILERWFPKASINGRPFDLRVLVIRGRAAHVAVRTSRSPITNLHLRNQRGDADEVRAALGTSKWLDAMGIAEAAARSFPGCHYCGVDLMIGIGGKRHAVAEVNAFGDHLHHERWNGMNPWETELRLWSHDLS